MRTEQIFLRNAGSALSEKISADYPADWDMSAVFERSWQKYAKSAESSAAGDTLEFSEAEVVNRRRRIFTAERIAVAACASFAVILAGTLLMIPERTDPSPDNVDDLPVVATTVVTSTTVESAATTTAEMSVSAVTETAETSESSATTSTAASAQTTTASETTAVSTTAATETTAPPEPAYYGHFEITKGAIPADEDFEQRDGLKYVRNEEVPIVTREHTRDFGEGFSVEEADDWRMDDVWADGYFVGTDDDTAAMVVFVDYDTAKTDSAFNSKLFSKCEETAVNGRPALLITSDSSDNFLLIFDEGCHLCAVLVKKPSEILNIDTIIEFAEKI